MSTRGAGTGDPVEKIAAAIRDARDRLDKLERLQRESAPGWTWKEVSEPGNALIALHYPSGFECVVCSTDDVPGTGECDCPPGERGATGPPGADGVGEPGPPGDPGDPGLSAYEVAVADGFVGDEAAWLASLVGAAGMDGVDGIDGLTILNGSGAPGGGLGVNGDFYIDTAAEAIYGPKTAGAWGSPTSLIGPAGATGATGATGSAGAAGVDGRTVLNGSGAPGGGTGANGDFYINTAANTIYGPKAAGVWGSPTSLVGPTGSTGATGAAGATGAQGDPGPSDVAWLYAFEG